MELWAVGLVLFSALLHSVWNYFAKSSLDKHVFSWWMKIFEFLIYLPVGLNLYFQETVPSMGWLIIVISGLIHFAYWVLLSSSYSHGDLSVVYPIARSAPLYVALFAVLFLGEELSSLGILGILSVALGVYTISLDSLNLRRLINPFSSWRNKGVIFAFLTALSVTAYSLVDKQGALYFHPILFVWIENAISLIPFTPLIAFSKRRHVMREWVRNRWLIVAGGFLGPLSYSIIIFVMQTFQVSYIVSIRQVSVVFGVILAGAFLKEGNIKKRLFSSTLIFAGLFLISIT